MLGLMTACVALAAAACGAKVTVDSTAGSSAGGGAGGVAGGSAVGGNTGTGLHGAGGASCFDPPDPATLTFCTAGVTTGGGMPQCENDFCDAKGNTWAAKCTTGACLCTFNDQEICTCALNGPGDFCNGTPSCCPLPGSK
jgi:hypothetical protein